MRTFTDLLRRVRRPRPARSAEGSAADRRRHFEEEGFLVLPGFLDDREVELVNRAVDRAWNDRSIYNPLTVTAFAGSPDYTETYVRNVDAAARAHNYKLNHLYLYDPGVLALLLGDAVQGIASELLGGSPMLFNSLNMERGSEQRFHFDTLYMPPPRGDRMVVFWFALEDVVPDAGALRYYPRSHLIPPYRFSHGQVWALSDEMAAFDEYIDREIAARGLEAVHFLPSKGDVFVWHARLYHGGAPIENPKRTRRSLVAHYWCAEDAPEQAWEVLPGRYVMDRRFMCVASQFQPEPAKREPTKS